MDISLAAPAGICASVARDKVADAVAAARQAEPYVDVVEIRLDALAEPEITPFVKSLAKPLLFTNRPAWEGGFFKGSETARVDLLLQAVQQNCGLVDLELKTAPALRSDLLAGLQHHPRTGLIISWHDFAGTPASGELADILQQQVESGAHIGKIVTTAHDFRDVLRVLNLQERAAAYNFPLIAFCMGPIGRISRLATIKLGGYMTYGTPDGSTGTAPGQIPVSVLRDILTRLDHGD